MKRFDEEVDANFGRFAQSYKSAGAAVAAALEAERDKFLASYRRMVSLQAWRSEVLEANVSPGSLAFFLEAQNDVLTSHVLASYGSWRSSLQALRSCIENIFFSMYYKDHPVELRLWEDGKHRIGFSEMAKYFEGHPAVDGLSPQEVGLAGLSTEYGTLSKAVHASASSFRMSVESIGVQLWSDDRARLGAWSTRESQVLTALNLFLMCLFRERLEGAQLPNLRKAISLAVPPTRHSMLKAKLGIVLFKRPAP